MNPQGSSRELSIALFFDLENLVRGLGGAGRRGFEPKLVIDRLLEKGKVLVKRAYADWGRFAKYKTTLHELGVDLIEIPQREISGKNSADIRMVVDAMDICFAKGHLDTFALASGDSDFSPLVTRLRENDKTVIGIGLKDSTGRILLENCDEFIFYEELVRQDEPSQKRIESVPADKREMFLLLLSTIQALHRENKDVLYSSMIKQTMKRKQPAFDEGQYGYASFSQLLLDARRQGLVELARDERSGSLLVREAGSTEATRAR
jgi:uncharacterized LabA/DUF88 family protein